MAKLDKHPTVWPLDPHTEAKLKIIRRYLGGWFPVLGSWQGRVVVIDGFAGPGRYQNNEPGSPLIALTTLLDHQARPTDCEYVFLFCEPDPSRFASLETTIEQIRAERDGFPDKVRVQALDQTFTEAMESLLGYLNEQKLRLAPTFAFVDPFGIKGVEMETRLSWFAGAGRWAGA